MPSMAEVDTSASVDAALNGKYDPLAIYTRWHNAPIAVDIPIGSEGEEVEINLQDLEDPTELCQLLENEKADRKFWVTVALAYARQAQYDYALDVLERGKSIHEKGAPKDRLSILSCMSWIYLLKSRHAPRTLGEGQDIAEVKTKEYYLKEATNIMNNATRINPAYPPLYLTRGVLNLLRASLATATKTGQAAESERVESLGQALKSFDEAIRFSDGRNLLALMGRARSLYLLKRYSQALSTYQQVLAKMPALHDPDPRIGIGACMWQMGYHENASTAWKRALSLNPKSNIAHTLLGIYHLRESGKFPSDHENFQYNYKRGVEHHLKTAYNIDRNHALNSAAFSTYFFNTKRFEVMDPLAKKAIERTDVNAIASDGWYLRARKEHVLGNFSGAADAYNRADQARGGQNAGYFPAKFGLIQLMLQSGDLQGAKFRLEKLFERNKSLEIMTLLGCIYAEDIFAALKANPKEDKSADIQKALRMLETVRKNWKDEKAKVRMKPDAAVLLYLARLYENSNPVESEKCLAEVESIQRDVIMDEFHFDAMAEDFTEQVQEQMPPQLHNNIGCFYYREEAFEQALQRFEIALNATLKLHEKQHQEKRRAEEENENADELDLIDTDALVTTISYNLARTQEALGQREDAIKTYEGLLNKRHSDYTDASARLAFVALQEAPQDQGPKQMQAMYAADYGHPEVRALMGWYYHSSKKKTSNLAEDQENRHYKHTLQGYDKHDVYSLVGMGNIHLNIARDMPRNSDAEKEKRTKMYQKAYEFFDKVLQLDKFNAYAAQGIAVALCDDKKSYSEALQILVKVKDAVRDVSVFQNLGHVYAELKQYQRSIDNYETALKKQIQMRKAKAGAQKSLNGDSDQAINGINGSSKVDHKEDAQLLACMSRVWLLKGKHDKSVLSLNTSLELMKRALATQADSPHLRFNVAFIQFQIVQLVNSLPDTDRTLEDVTSAKTGLEEAIATFEEVAQVKNPPYPKSALEQRAAMSKGTMMRQLERSQQQQTEYERGNEEKLKEAKTRREEELQQRAVAAQRRQEEEEARDAEMRNRREGLIKEASEAAEMYRQTQLSKEFADMTTDDETGERVKRQKRKAGGGKGSRKRKQRDDEDGFIEHDEDEDASDGSHRGARDRTPLSNDEEEGQKRPAKKRKRLERKAPKAVKGGARREKEGKFKSQAVVVDSDESDEEEEAVATPKSGADSDALVDAATPLADGDDDGDVKMRQADADAGGREEPVAAPKRKRKQLRTIADDDEDDEDNDAPRPAPSAPKSASRIIDDDDDE